VAGQNWEKENFVGDMISMVSRDARGEGSAQLKGRSFSSARLPKTGTPMSRKSQASNVRTFENWFSTRSWTSQKPALSRNPEGGGDGGRMTPEDFFKGVAGGSLSPAGGFLSDVMSKDRERGHA